MDMKIKIALENIGTMNSTTMHNIFHNQDDARIMLERYQNKYNQDNFAFYKKLCDIDRWKFDRFLKTLILDE